MTRRLGHQIYNVLADGFLLIIEDSSLSIGQRAIHAQVVRGQRE